MIAKLLVVTAAWLVISVLLSGVGALVRKRFRARVADESDLFFDFWVGWALTIAFLLAWHLVLPIALWTCVPIVVAGATGAWLARNDWSSAFQPGMNGRAWLAVSIILALIAVAALSLGPERQYDTALYHLQSVRWAQAYPVVPGLANVDSRFAMNSSFFLFGALIETVQIAGSNLRLAAGILFLPLIIQGILTLHAVVAGQRKMDLLRWFQVLMIPVALWQARQYSAALSPDGVMFALTVVMTGELIRILDGNDEDYRIFGIMMLAVTGVTVKVSFAIFGGAAAAIAIWKWSGTREGGWVPVTRMILPAIVVAALWMIHGVILSGYIAYPSPVGSFPVEWRLPPSVVKGQADWMVAWARSPGMHPRDVIGKHDWVARWVANTTRDRDVIGAALTLALAAVVRFVSPRREQPNGSAAPNVFLFLVPPLLAVVVWFVTAPAIRLTLGPLWVIGVGALSLAAAWSSELSLSLPKTRIAVHGALVSVLAVACAVGINESGSPSALYPVRRFTTLSGLVVNVPVKGDRCGDAPLPCSSLPPDEGLELRRPGTIANGFRVARDVAKQDYLRMNTPTGSANDARK